MGLIGLNHQLHQYLTYDTQTPGIYISSTLSYSVHSCPSYEYLVYFSRHKSFSSKYKGQPGPKG